MASQRQEHEAPVWPDALHAGLVQRLARPLTQPGLLQVRHLLSTLSRAEQMLHGSPVAEALYQRWGTLVADREGQLPIVYVRTPQALEPLTRGAPDNRQEGGQFAAPQADDGQPSQSPDTPVVQPLPASPPREPASALQDSPGGMTLPRLQHATSSEVVTMSTMAVPTPQSTGDFGHTSLQLASEQPTATTLSAALAGEVIQRSPRPSVTLQPRVHPKPVADEAPSGLSPAPMTHRSGRPDDSPPATAQASPGLTVVQAKFIPGLQPLSVARPRRQPQDGRTRNGQGFTPVATPVVRAQPTENSRQLLTHAARAMPMAGASPSVVQQTPLPAAKSSAARPAPRAIGPRRGASIRPSNVIQRQPNDVVQREHGESQNTEQTEGVDIDAIVDRVHRQFMRRLAVEGERRGVTLWP